MKRLCLFICLFTTNAFAYITPYFVNAGSTQSGTTDVTPGLPASIQVNDILLLVVESGNETVAAPSGYTEIDSQASMGTGTAGALGSTRLAVFWKRATASESAPTVTDPGDHAIARILAYRGCAVTGNPWDVESVGVQATTNTAAAWRSSGMSYGTNGSTVTTTTDNCLIIGIISHGNDTASVQFTSETYTTLGAASEVAATDVSATASNGGGFVFTSVAQTSAGNVVNLSTNDFTATIAATSKYAMMILALKPITDYPWVVSTAGSSGAGNVSPTFTCAANDILLLFVQSSNETITAPSGYTEIDTQANMATGTAITAGSLRLGVFWKRADGSETGVTVTDTGDHTAVTVLVIRGCITTGNPWGAESGGVQATTATSLSWQSAGFSYSGGVSTVSTTGANRLILGVVAHAVDNGTGQGSAEAFSNANVFGVLEETDNTTTFGTGGGSIVTSGRLAATGTVVDSSTNNFTATIATTSKYAMFVIALMPPSVGPTTAQKAAFFLLFP